MTGEQQDNGAKARLPPEWAISTTKHPLARFSVAFPPLATNLQPRGGQSCHYMRLLDNFLTTPKYAATGCLCNLLPTTVARGKSGTRVLVAKVSGDNGTRGLQATTSVVRRFLLTRVITFSIV